ncbi:MAG: NAD(P)-binding protein [Variovorax sp.]
MALFATDYLVVGAGAAAMAFVDTLLAEDPQARVLMVDKRGHVGGHWNDAYSFVRLHQPAAWYGVASRELAAWSQEPRGPNKGMFSLASGPEVLAHFEAVMRDHFLPSGRVEWLPKTEYLGSEAGVHSLRSLVTGEAHEVRTQRRLVYAAHANTEIPSTHPPRYEVGARVRCIPPNELPRVDRPYARYTVVGSGKTGMDACIWLLDNGVAPQRIRWIMPRDAWLMNRANVQPGPDGYERGMRNTIAQFEAIAQARDQRDLFRMLEERQVLMRIDPEVEPSTYRCAIVSPGELELLRRIRDVVRLGHVRALESTRILLERGTVEAHPDTLYVNCSAGAIQPAPKVPVFADDTINLLMVRWCQPLFSAAVVAWVESHVEGDAARNALCGVVPGPEAPLDWLRMWAITMRNGAAWSRNEAMQAWLRQCRLNGLAVMLKGVEITPAVKQLLQQVSDSSAAAAAKLPALMASVERKP